MLKQNQCGLRLEVDVKATEVRKQASRIHQSSTETLSQKHRK